MDKHQVAVMLKYEDKVFFCFCLLIGLSWKQNDLCQEFSVFIVPLMGFFLGQSHSFAGFREESPSRKSDDPHNDER